MSANTETTGADRTKCKAFCGMTIEDIKSDKSADCEWRDAPMEPHLWHNYRRYCTPACRDARLPPIAAPAFEHQALCRVERGGSCNCVPIAAPAANVERRKGKVEVGQLWRAGSKQHRVTSVDGEYVTTDVGGDARFHGPTMLTYWTLLADAKPEPAKPSQLNCAKCGRSTDVCQFACTDRGACELTDCPCLAKSLPAREAPKAATEQFWFTDDEGEKIGPFATGLEADDASVTYGAWMRTQTGKPYAGPARLPRPQLAADWVEDCLGDVR